ncbi:response regulator [Pseudomonas sp. GD03651]|jgi:two-component system, OmpR family, response regulator|uniref:Response regulator n=1 Tax=Pseudomonas fortuita TaxID=3233375 RepID=A0ACD4P7R6_9PSED|nr:MULTISPECIES: response regulator [Pseudomonas]ERT19931.1 transcriptional regulator [Pseudomonas putida SJ3]PNB56125.1 DNA-binding response regulator [Pseudomonas sp. FW305-130]PTC00136.1 DNA-binding response regulator [Thalassospira xiamenensis]AGN77367.1 transcriptional regulator [Pseudomonas putida H8234]EKT4451818.1 response regulator [Pseudomonas putida]
MSTTLLVVDDDDEIRELLCDYLTDAGYNVLAAAEGEQMREQLARHKVDLVVLDLMLPGEDGLSLCRQLQATRGLAVIMLSAKGSTLDRIIGLEVGADDYLAKPFEPRELIARIKAVLRRPQRLDPPADEPAVVDAQQFAGFRLEHVKRLLTRPDGETLTLPRSDYRVLRELLDANNRVVSRDQLTRSAFGRDHLPDDRSVDMCVSRLRQQLRRAPAGAAQILTIRNEGYLLSIANLAADA